MKTVKSITITGLALAGILTLSSCGLPFGAGQDAKPSSPSTGSESAPPTPASTAKASEGTAIGSGSYKAAPWAKPISDKGTKLGTIKGEGYNVDVYQVATDVASKDSMFLDKETKANLLPKGAPIVYLNYVVTNTSSADIPMTVSLVSMRAKYSDWKYLGGMPSDSSSAQYKKHGVDDTGYALDKNRKDKEPYILAPGESFNSAENFSYTAGKEVNIKSTLTPATPAGELDHDKRTEAEIDVTLK